MQPYSRFSQRIQISTIR
uniref:Uncharacterized protein n=1 Tax=Rhizophora mucronata TaxID=61149 RepID=A0A2P2R0D5_RHIMU